MKLKRIASLLLLATLLTLFASCSNPQDKILGTWKNEATALGIPTETTFEFKEDGSGVKTLPLGIPSPFTYVFENEKLVMTFDVLGIQTTYEYDYLFEGDSLLTLTKDNEVIELKRATEKN